ncbi:MAG: PDK repeat-containing protein, partial [Promethearchaeota archaeon CR_4]
MLKINAKCNFSRFKQPLSIRITCAIVLTLVLVGLVSSQKYFRECCTVNSILEEKPRVSAIASIEWNLTFGGVLNDEFSAVAVDEYNNAHTCGKTHSWGAGDYDSILVKYTSEGTLVWNETLGGLKNEEAQGIAVDSDGKASLTGLVESWAEGYCDALVAQYNVTGSRNWNETYGENLHFIRGMGIATDRNNNAYVAGIMYPPSGDYDAFLRRYNSGGVLEWSVRWNQSKIDAGE